LAAGFFLDEYYHVLKEVLKMPSSIASGARVTSMFVIFSRSMTLLWGRDKSFIAMLVAKHPMPKYITGLEMSLNGMPYFA